ncbi:MULTISPECIES: cupin domain-containing protein [unclassified Sinorhizobium]|uniref:cupin domain-containing protein n=1 Tax=unclassified Sinorhizobium TaxID=2613772 RepID=UPI003525DC2B
MDPIISLASLKLDHWSRGERYESTDTSFGSLIGLSGLGVSYSEVPPGKSGCPYHNHHGEDELFFILEGNGTYRFGEREFAFKAGDVLGAPCGGRETAHQIINTGETVLRYLGISTKVKLEVVEYPDSGKFLVSSHKPDGSRFRTVRRDGDEVDYWDGEPGT